MDGTKVCRDKDKCYRHMATPNEYRQSYADFASTLGDSDSRCENFSELWEPKPARARKVVIK